MNLRLGLPLQRAPEHMVITQPFGVNPELYAQFGLNGHDGLDFDAEDGELVVAVDEGEVVEVRFDASGYGVTVKLAHPWGESRYAHGQRYTVPVEFELGHIVRQGERIFLADSTGNSTGPHLHLGLRTRKDDGSLDYSNTNGFWGYEDPLPYLRDALGLAEPAPAEAAPRKSGVKG